LSCKTILIWKGTTNRITTRLVNKNSIAGFLYNLTNETWEGIYELNDVNEIFNLFIQTYLLIYDSSFPIKNVTMKHKNNGWITTGIQISCRCKKSLYIVTRNNNNHLFKLYYKCYCSILKKAIRGAKI
jgi:ribosomal protein L33